MKLEVNDIPRLHFLHQLWENELNFCKEEVTIYEHHLERLVTRYDDRDALAELEQLQNQFIRQKEVIDELNHEIHVQENEICAAAKKGLDFEVVEHSKLEEDIRIFRKLYHELKDHFHTFIRKYKVSFENIECD